MTTPKMMPGQEPYTPEEWERASRLISAAAATDPGEADEQHPDRHEGWTNRATWYASVVLHNEHALYRDVHDAARLAALREHPWSVATWQDVLMDAWRNHPGVTAEHRRALRDMAQPVEWREIAADCAEEIKES